VNVLNLTIGQVGQEQSGDIPLPLPLGRSLGMQSRVRLRQVRQIGHSQDVVHVPPVGGHVADEVVRQTAVMAPVDEGLPMHVGPSTQHLTQGDEDEPVKSTVNGSLQSFCHNALFLYTFEIIENNSLVFINLFFDARKSFGQMAI